MEELSRIASRPAAFHAGEERPNVGGWESPNISFNISRPIRWCSVPGKKRWERLISAILKTVHKPCDEFYRVFMKIINFLNIHHRILIHKNFTNNSVTYYTLCMKDMVKSAELPELAGYVSVKEAAEMIGCTPSRIYQYIASGLLPAQKIGRMRILPREAVRTFKRSPAGIAVRPIMLFR